MCYYRERPKTSKTASVLKWIDTNSVLKERYIIGQHNTIYIFSINISLSSKFDLFCPLLDKDISIENAYIVLS